jgi:hypothetical protein
LNWNPSVDMVTQRFEVLWPKGIVHRGSATWDNKLIGKAKKGEVLEGHVILGEDHMGGNGRETYENFGHQISTAKVRC